LCHWTFVRFFYWSGEQAVPLSRNTCPIVSVTSPPTPNKHTTLLILFPN
jgi:hypothetical protein